MVYVILLEAAESEDDRAQLKRDLRVEEWRVMRTVEQRTLVAPREEGAPAWWYGDEDAASSAQAAAIQLRQPPR